MSNLSREDRRTGAWRSGSNHWGESPREHGHHHSYEKGGALSQVEASGGQASRARPPKATALLKAKKHRRAAVNTGNSRGPAHLTISCFSAWPTVLPGPEPHTHTALPLLSAHAKPWLTEEVGRKTKSFEIRPGFESCFFCECGKSAQTTHWPHLWKEMVTPASLGWGERKMRSVCSAARLAYNRSAVDVVELRLFLALLSTPLPNHLFA